MLGFGGAFERDTLQLHQLNQRLRQYVSRVRQLEQENRTLSQELTEARRYRGAGGRDGVCRVCNAALAEERSRCEEEVRQLQREAQEHVKLLTHLDEQVELNRRRYKTEVDKYQATLGELEDERRLLESTIAENLKEHHKLMQAKMGLSQEVAAYRALLEGERRERLTGSDQHANKLYRNIDIKTSTYPYVQKSIPTRQDGRTLYPTYSGSNVRHTGSSLKSSASQFGSPQTTRVVPIIVTRGNKQSSPSPKYVPSVSRMQHSSSTSVRTVFPVPEKKEDIQKTKEQSASVNRQQSSVTRTSTTEVKVELPPAVSQGIAKKSECAGKTSDVKVTTPGAKEEPDVYRDSVVRSKVPSASESIKIRYLKLQSEEMETEHEGDPGIHVDDKEATQTEAIPREGGALEANVMEEIIEKVVKPAGINTNIGSSPVSCHVERSEQDDGRTKTEIILESKVEEDLDVSDDSVLEELLGRGVKKVTLEDIKGTPTGNMIESLLHIGLQGSENLENKSVKVEIVEEPAAQVVEEHEVKTSPSCYKPSSMFFQIEEIENDPANVSFPEDNTAAGGKFSEKETTQLVHSSIDQDAPYLTQIHEGGYYVSTPDDNISESDDVAQSSFGHYSVLEDLSDERYYQDDAPVSQRVEETELYRGAPNSLYATMKHAFTKESFPECIIEEEIHVSPTVQESVLEVLREESLGPQEQLRGVFANLQGSVPESLKEELSLLTSGDQDGSENVTVDVRKVEQSGDNGTVTIVAELNVSHSLEDSGLLEEQGFEMPVVHRASDGGTGIFNPGAESKSSTFNQQDWYRTSGGHRDASVTEESAAAAATGGRMEKHIKLGPVEKAFTFQMDLGNVTTSFPGEGTQEAGRLSEMSGEEMEDVGTCAVTLAENVDKMGGLGRSWVGQTTYGERLEPQVKGHQQKKVATVYLENQKDD